MLVHFIMFHCAPIIFGLAFCCFFLRNALCLVCVDCLCLIVDFRVIHFLFFFFDGSVILGSVWTCVLSMFWRGGLLFVSRVVPLLARHDFFILGSVWTCVLSMFWRGGLLFVSRVVPLLARHDFFCFSFLLFTVSP